MQLAEQLSNWDGKSATYLAEIFERDGSAPEFIDQLLGFLSEETIQAAATWLLKHALENGGAFEQRQIYSLFDKADILIPWQARLHLLQIMASLTVPDELKYKLADFCRSSTEDDNKFVRAWGYNGLYELANAYEEYRDGLDIVFAAAMETEPASVKARLRNIKKKINANWH